MINGLPMELSEGSPPSDAAARVLSRVTARGVVKTFGMTSVLRGASFELLAGTITVLSGPNGAGKTTLLSILSGEKRATRGQVSYVSRDGRALGGRDARRHIGWVSHEPLSYLELSARENLSLVAELHGSSLDAVEHVCSRLGMTGFANKPVSTLSRGQKQRVALGRALVHDPDFLLLDEPWTGLDAAATRFLEDLLSEQAARGAIVFIVSHQREVISKLGASELRLESGLVTMTPPPSTAADA